jgi:hypothetical protein
VFEDSHGQRIIFGMDGQIGNPTEMTSFVGKVIADREPSILGDVVDCANSPSTEQTKFCMDMTSIRLI